MYSYTRFGQPCFLVAGAGFKLNDQTGYSPGTRLICPYFYSFNRTACCYQSLFVKNELTGLSLEYITY
jgi:hypothetical protein